MAMNLGGGGGVKSDINVTPLVDVMLVLLIIMMLIAPLLQQGVPVTMPEASNTGEKPDTQDQTVVMGFRPEHLIPISAEYNENVYRAPVEMIEPMGHEAFVYLKGDKDAKYSAIMDAMDAFRKAQIENIALITEKKNKPGAAGGSQ